MASAMEMDALIDGVTDMKNSTKALATGALVAALMVGATGTAYAGTQDSTFNETLPTFQIPGWTDDQHKEISNRDGHVRVGSVGSDYVVDVEMCQSVLLVCGTKRFGLNDRSTADLPNGFAAGSKVRLQMRVGGGGNVVKVQVQGTWRSN
ncbi:MULTISPECIES: hypothetical protein [unclassified Rathayibacter]|uniref:hypothetical protein n=2 Tax=Rathayibacter TaxID=33886 RepID=UPI000F4D1062|nr:MULTISPECIES: hypothetical protein [unclassified Rathayibacter]MCJ1672603.1 hypothetical protein [Rathayibacter sp. VKM Ac-2929]MCJ1682081.1 hypothetical protein [Rathayibacter sp. VKM Ac-2928]